MTEKHGQIAHLDDDRANSSEDNLAFLCLEHHSVYDTTTSQHKGYTIQEAKKARADLYGAVEQGLHLSVTAIRGQGREADRKTLADIIRKLGKETIPFLRIVSFQKGFINCHENVRISPTSHYEACARTAYVEPSAD